jgi:hypothetical protein
MRTPLLLLLFIPLSCARKNADRPVESKPPDAIGGGPLMIIVPTADARTTIARARCRATVACEDAEFDACVTREEAMLPSLPCVTIDRDRLDACVEATRARTCTDPATPPECAVDQLCSKEGR